MSNDMHTDESFLFVMYFMHAFLCCCLPRCSPYDSLKERRTEISTYCDFLAFILSRIITQVGKIIPVFDVRGISLWEASLVCSCVFWCWLVQKVLLSIDPRTRRRRIGETELSVYLVVNTCFPLVPLTDQLALPPLIYTNSWRSAWNKKRNVIENRSTSSAQRGRQEFFFLSYPCNNTRRLAVSSREYLNDRISAKVAN